MICKNKPLLDDIELLMAVDGAANPEVEMHLSHCSPCSQRAAKLASLQRRATSQLFRAACPPSLELGEYHLGLLPAAMTAVIQQHVATCPYCQRELTQLTTFIDAPDPYLHPALATVVRQHVQVLIARLTGGPQLGGLFKQPGLAPALAGLRGDESGPLTYEAGGAQIIVEVEDDEARPGRRVIIGLVVGLEAQRVDVHVWRDEQAVAKVAVDEAGNFVVEDLAPGRYELFISGEADDIHLQDLQV
jgi:anti-sigma factor RsiW